jgi:glycosyltransferase involved in cell wall biosynthesis
VSVVALSGDGGDAATELQNAGVEFISLKMRKGLADPRGWIVLNRWLWHARPDVVHTHLPHATCMARWSRIAAPVPVLVDTLHSSNTGKPGRQITYAISRWLTDQVTAVSEATAASHLTAGMVGQSKLSVLGNGIEKEAWLPDATRRAFARGELGVANEFLWLSVGRLEALKDYPTMLGAFAALPKSARLLVLGEGPLRGELVQLAARLGLSERVQFMGFVPDVARWMRAADGFVLSSRYEGLPMVLLEAGACGLPIVATNVDGTREVISNEATGLLTPAGDADGLADAMTRLMHAPIEERRAMGERARRSVLERFSLESVLDRWEDLYSNLLVRGNTDRRIRLSEREVLKRHSATSA